MENRSVYLLRLVALILILISFFIRLDFLSKSFLFSGIAIGILLFNKEKVEDMKKSGFLKNTYGLFLILLLSTGVSFIVISDFNVKIKLLIAFLLLLFLIWRIIKYRVR